MARRHPPHPQHVSQVRLKQPCQRHTRVILFFQLGDLHVRVHFGFVSNFAVRLLIRTFFIDSFVKGLFLVERRTVRIWPRPVAIFSESTPPSNPLAVSQTDSDAETSTDERQDNSERTPLFGVAKCVLILPNAEASVSVTTSSARLIHMAPHRDSMRNRMFLPASGIFHALPNMPIPIRITNFSKKLTTLP